MSQLVSDFPEISEMDLNPVFATKEGAIAADVRIVVNFDPKPARYRPAEEDVVTSMNRIMKPKAVAVIGASNEAGKIGNSVMKNLINGGYKGQIYPIHPKDAEVMGLKAYKSVKDVPGEIDTAVFAIPAKLVAGALKECGEKKIAGAILIPSGFGETGNIEGQDELHRIGRKYNIRLMGPNIYGFYYTPANLAPRSAPPTTSRAPPRCRRSPAASAWPSSASRARPRWACRPSSAWATSPTSTRTTCCSSSSRTTTPRYRAALRGPEGRPRVRRGRQARVEEEAGHRAQGRPHRDGRGGCQLAHRRPRRQRQDLRGRPAPVGRHPRPGLRDMLEFARGVPILPTPKGENVVIITGAGGSGVLLSDACVDNGLS